MGQRILCCGCVKDTPCNCCNKRPANCPKKETLKGPDFDTPEKNFKDLNTLETANLESMGEISLKANHLNRESSQEQLIKLIQNIEITNEDMGMFAD